MPIEKLVWKEIDNLAGHINRLGDLIADGETDEEHLTKLHEQLWGTHITLVEFFGAMYERVDPLQKFPVTLTVFKEDDTVEGTSFAYTQEEAHEKARRWAKRVERKNGSRIRVDVTWVGPGEDVEEGEDIEDEDDIIVTDEYDEEGEEAN